jgi:uncharacterized protein YciI
MRQFILCITLLTTCLFATAQKENSSYNKALADSLGADDYGMKKYVFVILKTGTNKTTDKHFVDSMLAGHMKNIGKLAKAGKLVVAGPMLGKNNKEYRGIFVLNTASLDEANELLKTDPAIFSNLLEPEVYSWYCSAALPMFLPLHDKVKKKSF